CLIALGSIVLDGQDISIEIQPGGRPMTSSQAASLIAEIKQSVFTVEAPLRNNLIDSVNAGEKVVWLRGSVVVKAGIRMPPDLQEIHFEASRTVFPPLPYLPFIYVEEGTSHWL